MTSPPAPRYDKLANRSAVASRPSQRHDSARAWAQHPDSPRETRFDTAHVAHLKGMSPSDETRDSPEPNYRLHGERQLERRSHDDFSHAYDRGVLNKIGGPAKSRSSVSSNSLNDSPLLMSSPTLRRPGHARHVSDARTSATDSPPPHSTSPDLARAIAVARVTLSPRPEQLAGIKRRASSIDDQRSVRPYYPQPTSEYQPLHAPSVPAPRHQSPHVLDTSNSLPSITTLDPELRKKPPGPGTELPWQSAHTAHSSGSYICDCCPKKPKRFGHEEDLRLHHLEKQYTCLYCPNRFKNKNEAERHQNSLHLRKHSWSCAALTKRQDAFHPSPGSAGATDQCGYCGDEFPNNPADWPARFEHLDARHKFGECNQAKKFFRADHFRQHLKHSHGGTSGKWTNTLENACMRDEAPPVPMDQRPAPQSHSHSHLQSQVQGLGLGLGVGEPLTGLQEPLGLLSQGMGMTKNEESEQTAV